MSKFGLAFKVPKAKRVSGFRFFGDALSRNMEAASLSKAGYKVRKLTKNGVTKKVI